MARQTFLRLGIWGSVAAVCVFAFCFRAARLEERPMHGDEANQAVRAGGLMDEGIYRYDPSDHHGPVMYYAALPFCRATAKTFADTTEWAFRMVPVAFSLMTLLLMAGLYAADRRNLFAHPAGVVTAVLLTALSPAMNYYSRFFIQETMFVTFLTGMLVCAAQYVRAGGGTRKGAWMAGGFGMFLGLAAATKETVVLSVAAAGVAAVCACGFRRLLRAWNTRDFLIMLGAAALVAALFFSSFFTYPKGLSDAAFATVSAYLRRAVVEDHRHPWSFYLKLLFWKPYEPASLWAKAGVKDALWVMSNLYAKGRVWCEAGVLALPALFAAVMAFMPRKPSAPSPQTRWLRFVAVYTLALTALYSAIPYKTPWCVLSFLHGYILLAGVGVGLAWERLTRLPTAWRWASIAGMLALLAYGAFYQGAQSWRACFELAADIRNPYVYVHPRKDVMALVSAIGNAAQKADGFDTPIAVVAPPSDYWPLPWYLRKYAHVYYWDTVADVHPGFEPAVLVVAAGQVHPADARFGKGKDILSHSIRPYVNVHLFVPASPPGSDE